MFVFLVELIIYFLWPKYYIALGLPVFLATLSGFGLGAWLPPRWQTAKACAVGFSLGSLLCMLLVITLISWDLSHIDVQF